MGTTRSIHVRLARPRNAEALAAVHDALGYPPSASQIAARLQRIAADASYRTWVGQVDGQAAGLPGARVGWVYEHDGAHVQLLALAVAEQAQGCGVGGALRATVEAWAREHQATAVIIDSDRQRADAHAFYRARRYADTGSRFVEPLPTHRSPRPSGSV